MNNKQKILSFWRDIEVFNLPDLQKEAKRFTEDMSLPWLLDFEPDEKLMWRHYVFLGKHAKQHILDCIDSLIDADNPERDFVERPSGETCMAVMIIDENGRPLSQGGYLQAAYIQGLWCLQHDKDLHLVNERLELGQEGFRERYPLNPEAEDLEDLLLPVIHWPHFKKEIAVLNDLQLTDITCAQAVHIHSVKISRKSTNEVPFLNSFYLDDLNDLLQKKKHAKGLDDLLKDGIHIDQRIDVLKDAEVFFNHLDPALLSRGKWPSSPAYGLYAAQFGAVTHSIDYLSREQGIIGVNGPPGTGKTTLLKDIIADIIVERAKKIMDSPDIFLGLPGKRINTDYHYFAINEDVFTNTGIVVASNNNAAVENISKELPAQKNIDPIFTEAAYLKDFSKGLIEDETWGCLAAALGNSKNKTAFKDGFWWGKQTRTGFRNYLLNLYKNDEGIDHSAKMKRAFDKEVEELKKLLKEFELFKKDAATFHQMLFPHIEDRKKRRALEANVRKLMVQLGEQKTLNKTIEDKLAGIKREIESSHKSLAFHVLTKPSFFWFKKLFGLESYKKWMGPYLLFVADLEKRTKEGNLAEQELRESLKKINALQKQLQTQEQLLTELQARMNTYVSLKRKLTEKHGIDSSNIPDAAIFLEFGSKLEEIHKMNPWSSPSVNILRSAIFLKSLRIHELAIFSNPKPFYNNLNLFMAMLDGRTEVSESLSTNLWKTFFFCIPVVSTSLASVSKLFRNVKPESIGWLLIDEAGQATPQSIAGIVNRAKRAIIIGDPIQIPPVVTLPEKLIHLLNAPYKLDDVWFPSKSSAQELADRISLHGSAIGLAEEPVWTGFPLRTHRRCNNPMFNLANDIAYNGQMVKAQEDAPCDCPLGPSVWFNVKGTTVKNKQVVVEEIEMLREKLEILKSYQGDVYVISPFKSVARECQEMARRIRSKALCGTIHTFQGKEADIVFLVLGSDPESPGSRLWASAKPNMLNVALTRAKYRFYVIGNKKLWQGMPYFKTLAIMWSGIVIVIFRHIFIH